LINLIRYECAWIESTYSIPSSKPAKDIASSKDRTKSGSINQQATEKVKDTPEEAKVEPAAVSKFFKRLSDETEADNPLEEMFRLFGGDLCTQHPENCERYLKSYKDVRSKTSHINSLRDPYEFGKLDGSEVFADKVAPPQQFAMSKYCNRLKYCLSSERLVTLTVNGSCNYNAQGYNLNYNIIR